MFFRKSLALLLLGVLSLSKGYSSEAGTFINPITDVCWECIFPITLAGVNLTPGHKDFQDESAAFCSCAGIPPKVGIPISFWEPTRLVEVTRHAYKLLGMGGISIGQESVKNRGSIGIVGEGPHQSSFYHAHWYSYPLLSWLEIFTDFMCVEKGDLDIGYMSEFDPLWNDDQWALALNGEGLIFNNPAAQIACIQDCLTTSRGKPNDELFWCAGCQGSLYPFTGTVAHHVGGLQASSLLVHRLVAKFHRQGLLKGFSKNNFCEAKYQPIIQKSHYKTQLIYPISNTSGPCQALGSSDQLWGSKKSFPGRGEDFIYLLWTKKHCCLDAVKPAMGKVAS